MEKEPIRISVGEEVFLVVSDTEIQYSWKGRTTSILLQGEEWWYLLGRIKCVMSKEKGKHMQQVIKVAEIMQEYGISDSEEKRSPGKFEGQPLWVVYFYAMSLDGDGEVLHDMEEDGDVEVKMEVNSEERWVFPDLQDATHVSILEDSVGFAYGKILEKEETHGQE